MGFFLFLLSFRYLHKNIYKNINPIILFIYYQALKLLNLHTDMYVVKLIELIIKFVILQDLN